MPRRRTKTENNIIVYAIAAVVLVVIGLFNFMADNPLLLWVLLAFAAIVIALVWYTRKQENEKRRLAEEAAEEACQRAEEERIKTILDHKGEWGDSMCQWLADGRYSLTDSRTAAIMNNFVTLGQDTCQRLLQKTIAIGDSPNSVMLALGEPRTVDEQVTTEKENKFRWIYGFPRQGATYIWFKNGKVTKIKE
jgi:Ca2+/Na+ antiporter